MPGSEGLGFLVILNKSSELRFELRRSELIFRTGARPVQFVDCGARARWLGQWVESWRWTNSQHRKIVSLSPRVENLNLKKVIKVSYLNQESRQCFVFSEFYEHMYISHICIMAMLRCDRICCGGFVAFSVFYLILYVFFGEFVFLSIFFTTWLST